MVVLQLLLIGMFFIGARSSSAVVSIEPVAFQFNSMPLDSLPGRNQQVLNYVIKHGAKISPTYESAVCTELLIGVLKNFTILTKVEKSKIRIISDENIYQLRLHQSPIPKGVFYALTESKKGIAIDQLEDVRPGDFVQFWYVNWGHCGIVKSIDRMKGTMQLYSSYPSTNGYGIQTFDIPNECYFVRLK